MPKKRPARPQAEQLVFPFELRVGDVIDDEGIRSESRRATEGRTRREDDPRLDSPRGRDRPA